MREHNYRAEGKPLSDLQQTKLMGMYTELIFGADLKSDTPRQVILTLAKLIGQSQDELEPENEVFKTKSGRTFNSSSYYFLPGAVNKMWFDAINNGWSLSIRCSLKNYKNEIEDFLEWIKPYIDGGSGQRGMYAIVTFEEADEPTIYYLHEKESI